MRQLSTKTSLQFDIKKLDKNINDLFQENMIFLHLKLLPPQTWNTYSIIFSFVFSISHKSCILQYINYLLWKLVSVLYTNEFATLTNVTWNQAKDEYIVCGTEGGAVYLLDRREPKTFVEVYHCFNNKINRLSHNPNSNQVAVCGDTSEIIVLDWNGEVFTKIYDNSEHQGIAKGLCWTENVLYSCGLDTKICKHTF